MDVGLPNYEPGGRTFDKCASIWTEERSDEARRAITALRLLWVNRARLPPSAQRRPIRRAIHIPLIFLYLGSIYWKRKVSFPFSHFRHPPAMKF
jgi:hypothetical protein